MSKKETEIWAGKSAKDDGDLVTVKLEEIKKALGSDDIEFFHNQLFIIDFVAPRVSTGIQVAFRTNRKNLTTASTRSFPGDRLKLPKVGGKKNGYTSHKIQGIQVGDKYYEVKGD